MTAQKQQSAPSQEQINRLEGIFHPLAKRRREKLYDEAPDSSARFVHYTSAEAALKIITTKRLWMRSTTAMADFREVQHGFEIFQKAFSKPGMRDAFIQAFDQCAPQAGLKAITQFDQWLPDIFLGTFIASLSEHKENEDLHGRLSMWRAFGGNNSARVAIVVKVPKVTQAQAALNVMFSPVAYSSPEEVQQELEAVIQNVRDNAEFLKNVDPQIVVGWACNVLVAGVACLKHEGFSEECEWRVVYFPNRSGSSLIESSMETVLGVPQIVYKLPFDLTKSEVLGDLDLPRIFDRLILGPSPYPWVMWSAFVEALSKVGVMDAAKKVFVSGIPIRP